MSSANNTIIASIIQGSVGAEWAAKQIGWSTTSELPVCEWYGIECDPIDDSISAIDLTGTDLRATIPSEWGQLLSLISLRLSENELFGSIPSEITKLPKLERFELSHNVLSGTIPHLELKDLRIFNISHNRLKGSLPDDMADLNSNIVLLDVSQNKLKGTISSLIPKRMYQLVYCDMSYNELYGSIPSNLGSLKHLQGLFLNDNELVGTIPPSLGSSDSTLIQMFLEHNRLSGTIPAALAEIPQLTDLFVDGNKFTGTVPHDLCIRNLNEDFYYGKYNMSGRNGCTSIACPVNTVSKEGVYPCIQCPHQGFNPYLGHNGYCYHLNEKIILDNFYDHTSGPTWFGGSGWGLANVPVCSYEGVECNNAGHIISIELAGMNLRGSIPDELGYLKHLKKLNLSDNALYGQLPSDLRWPPLESLDVSGNHLIGFVPPMLCLDGDVNGNGAGGQFHCDVIACPQGTSSPIGRASPKGVGVNHRYVCSPCNELNFLGSKKCDVSISHNIGEYVGEHIIHGHFDAFIILLFSFLFCFCFILAPSSLRSKDPSIYEEFGSDDGSIYSGGYESGVTSSPANLEEDDVSETLSNSAAIRTRQYLQLLPANSNLTDSATVDPDLAPTSAQAHGDSLEIGTESLQDDDFWLDIPKVG